MPQRPPRPPPPPSQLDSTLSEEEVERVRALLERSARVKWLWATLQTWAVWIAAVVGGATIGWDAIKRLIALAGKG